MNNQQQQAGVELSDEQIDSIFYKHAGTNTFNQPYLTAYEQSFRHIARDLIAADRQQRGKVEPVGWEAEHEKLLGLVVKPSEAEAELVIADLKADGYRGGSIYPLYRHAPQAEKAPSVQAVEAEDPLDTPLPCDITVGHMTMRKGVALRNLVSRLQTLNDMVHQQPRPLSLLNLQIGGRCEKHLQPKPCGMCAAPQQPSVPDGAKAIEALERILKITREYLPPGGTLGYKAMGQILEVIDPWPLADAPRSA